MVVRWKLLQNERVPRLISALEKLDETSFLGLPVGE